MNKSFRMLIFVFFAALVIPLLLQRGTTPQPTVEPEPTAPTAVTDTVRVLMPEGACVTLPMRDYLVGVVAAEMPASFEPEALKAQTVAACTYALHCRGKHDDADVCTDFACCQAWQSDAALRERWGADYGVYLEKISSAVDAVAGAYLALDGEPILAAFHSSSAGCTENCADVWGSGDYLVSVPSPETAETVPNYVTTVECSALDFRDTVLSEYPQADLSGEPDTWVGELTHDAAGRVSSLTVGGVPIPGTVVRRLFSLRSTAFTLDSGEGFVFTVTGSGHGVGMSQYGANVMAQDGASWRDILAHYYPSAQLVFG